MRIITFILAVCFSVLCVQEAVADEEALQRRLMKLRRKLQQMQDKNTARANDMATESAQQASSGATPSQNMSTPSTGGSTYQTMPSQTGAYSGEMSMPAQGYTGMNAPSLGGAEMAAVPPPAPELIQPLPLNKEIGRQPQSDTMYAENTAIESLSEDEAPAFQGEERLDLEKDKEGKVTRSTKSKKGAKRLLDDSLFEGTETTVTDHDQLSIQRKQGEVTTRNLEGDVDYTAIKNKEGTRKASKAKVDWKWSSTGAPLLEEE
jgi:hypothetical protein